MKLSYDLIIIGGTLESIWAAEYAVGFGARIGLIIPDNSFLQLGENIFHSPDIFNIPSSNFQQNLVSLIKEQKRLITEEILPRLEAMGVDVIFSTFEFEQKKKLSLRINQDRLEATAYLLIDSSQLFLNYYPIDSWQNYLTIEDLINKFNWEKLPEKLVIIGDDITTINLAQILTKFGKKVTIITHKKSLLSCEDQDLIFSMQVYLEAQGIKILTNSQVTQIKLIEGDKWLQAGNKAIEAGEIIITNKFDSFSSVNQQIEDKLGLSKIGIDLSLQRIIVNSKLKTQHPQIYACGNLLGGYNIPNLTQYEAKIAVKNALFLPLHSVNYQTFPYGLSTYPVITRIGLTESQAKDICGNNINIIKFRLLNRFNNFSDENLTTLVKIILDEKNYILGCHFFNLNNDELITIFSSIIQQNKNIESLFKIPIVDNFSQTIVNKIYYLWRMETNQKNKFITDLRETFFIWKRN